MFFYVNCVDVTNVEYMILELKKDNKFIKVLPRELKNTIVEYPDMMPGLNFQNDSVRIDVKVKLMQFPVIPCNAMTVHKLQGQSLDCVVASEWNESQNWIYVLLSRIRKSSGIYTKEVIKEKLQTYVSKLQEISSKS